MTAARSGPIKPFLLPIVMMSNDTIGATKKQVTKAQTPEPTQCRPTFRRIRERREMRLVANGESSSAAAAVTTYKSGGCSSTGGAFMEANFY